MVVPVLVFLGTLMMGFYYVRSAILSAQPVSIYLQFVKVVIPHNSELLLAIYVLAKMDIIIVVQTFVLNVTLPVNPALILQFIAYPAIH